MDPNNPVVKLLVEGMGAESEGRGADARVLFERAWADRKDDYDGCMAAHYLARHQDTTAETLQWNQEALRLAQSVGDDRITGFFPSLYLNLGQSYETVGELDEARRYYSLALAHLETLPTGPYPDLVRDGVRRGLERVT